jgi:hypothetical protein
MTMNVTLLLVVCKGFPVGDRQIMFFFSRQKVSKVSNVSEVDLSDGFRFLRLV